MLRPYAKSLLGFVMALCSLMLLISGSAIAQNQDPLVGTWNIQATDGTMPSIGVMSFNLGGTTTEFDTAGTNASASPGESIGLGKWSKTANLTYTFKEENYIYDSSGNLSLLAVTSSSFSLDSSLKRLSGTGTANFFSCSISVCPGQLVVGPIALQVSGRRF